MASRKTMNDATDTSASTQAFVALSLNFSNFSILMLHQNRLQKPCGGEPIAGRSTAPRRIAMAKGFEKNRIPAESFGRSRSSRISGLSRSGAGGGRNGRYGWGGHAQAACG